MQIKDLFASNVTRDIPPVVYHHEQDPAKVQDEVSEYIVTGGYPKDDPRHKRVPDGIHEQMVNLLKNIAGELSRGAVPLPASWISGFYGSGKSSFAKLLGLSLDKLVLPDQRSLVDVLVARDDSPLRQELKDAWQGLLQRVDSIAVVFDIGSVARNEEQVHSAVKRQVQKRLGYCAISQAVAEDELKLELANRWGDFLSCAQQTLGRPWLEAVRAPFAEDDFSHVMSVLQHDRYLDPVAWLDSRAGRQTGEGASVEESTKAIADMLDQRAPGKSLFIIVDEVSQYVHQNENRMLKLQSFVSDLGQKLKGRVWLLVTGQQKLDDADDTISKLKDRFPDKLRVHLSPTNIRDVVHKRLLRKDPSREAELRKHFKDHRPDLRLYAYGCEEITEDDFVDVYPMLPGQVDLLMQITTNLRSRSTRVKGDDQAIRGLLQLLGELFRLKNLGDQDLGYLLSLDQIYDVQHSALDADVQNSLMRLFNEPAVKEDPLAQRVAKAVALLELIQESKPTTSKLVSQCLYQRMGEGTSESTVTAALEKMRETGLLAYSDQYGYKIQSSSGQEWQRERDQLVVTGEQVSDLVIEKLRNLLGACDRPRLKTRSFPLAASFSDGRHKQDERVQAVQDAAVLAIDFRYLSTQDERAMSRWVQESDTPALRDRLVWVAGKTGAIPTAMRELVRSRHMVGKYRLRPGDKQRLLFEEETRLDQMLEKTAQAAVIEAFLEGELYFQGGVIDKGRYGTSFPLLLTHAAEEVLPTLYRHFVDMSVTPRELEQLLEPQLSGPSTKFMGDGLGILELDGGKFVFTCTGPVLARIVEYVIENNGVSGQALLSNFGGPPYGYAPDVIRACLAGLIRGNKIQVRPESGAVITSIKDPGVKDLFSGDRGLRKAQILPPGQIDITAKDLAAMCRFFDTSLNAKLDRETDAIVEAVFDQFPSQAQKLRDLEARLNRLPGDQALPPTLSHFQDALADCTRSRQAAEILRAVKKHLDALREGVQQLGILSSDLTEPAIEIVRRAHRCSTIELVQLRDAHLSQDVEADAESIATHLQGKRPWIAVAELEPAIRKIQTTYEAARQEQMERQEQHAQQARQTILAREDVDKLTSDEVSQVLSPLQAALIDTTPQAVQPPLVVLRDTLQDRLSQAIVDANVRLDDLLSRKRGKQVIRVTVGLAGRELETSEDVDRLLADFRERLLAQLKPNRRLRLV